MVKDLGRVIPIYHGAYDSSASYELNDLVVADGTLYWHVGKEVTIGVEPSTDEEVWGKVLDLTEAMSTVSSLVNQASNSATVARAAASAAQEILEEIKELVPNIPTDGE